MEEGSILWICVTGVWGKGEVKIDSDCLRHLQF